MDQENALVSGARLSLCVTVLVQVLLDNTAQQVNKQKLKQNTLLLILSIEIQENNLFTVFFYTHRCSIWNFDVLGQLIFIYFKTPVDRQLYDMKTLLL